jgi:hypothetical protein
MADTTDVTTDGQSPKVRFTVVIQNGYTLDTGLVTGRLIKETAGIPAGHALYRRAKGGTEPIGDDESVEVHDGDHFFSRSPSTLHERT